MAKVRAKFKVDRIEAHEAGRCDEDGEYHVVEMRTIVFRPVYSEDPEHENKKFWDATPEGEIRLGTVNPEAWQALELGQEYYVDFTPAKGV